MGAVRELGEYCHSSTNDLQQLDLLAIKLASHASEAYQKVPFSLYASHGKLRVDIAELYEGLCSYHLIVGCGSHWLKVQ